MGDAKGNNTFNRNNTNNINNFPGREAKGTGLPICAARLKLLASPQFGDYMTGNTVDNMFMPSHYGF